MTNVAFILARRGSKGLPGKNTRTIGGRACIEWSIDAALSVRRIHAVAVSSDDEHALDIARSLGVDALARPADLASDTARVDDALRHAASAYETRTRAAIDTVVLLYGNVPVRPAGLIDSAIETFEHGGFDSVQSYCDAGKHHPWWTARIDPGSGAITPWEGNVLNHGVYRRQDLPPACVPDGGVLVLRRKNLLSRHEMPHAFLGSRVGGVRTRPGEVVDIDNEIDAIVADTILSRSAAAA